jgi:ribosomal protein L31E
VKAVKEFLVQHMKIRDRDLKKIRLDKSLNEVIWSRGIKKPPVKVKVKATKEGDIVRVELAVVPEKLKFKKLREEKMEKKAMQIAEKKKSVMEKAKESMQKTPETKTEEEKKDEGEKAKAVEEAGKEMGKAAAKQVKHQVSAKEDQQKHQIRKTLAK